MALAMKLDFSDEKVRKSLDQFSRESGIAVKDVVADQMRLWVQSFMSPHSSP